MPKSDILIAIEQLVDMMKHSLRSDDVYVVAIDSVAITFDPTGNPTVIANATIKAY